MLALDGCKTNWTAEVRSAIHSIAYQGPGPSPSLDPMPVDGIMDLWMLHYNLYWAAFQEDTGSYRDPTARNRSDLYPVLPDPSTILPPGEGHAWVLLQRPR